MMFLFSAIFGRITETIYGITCNTSSMARTKVTSKHQTTIPQEVRKVLKVKPGEEVEWYVVKGLVVVDASKKMKNPVEFLVSQVKLDLDAVRLVREAREDFR